MTRDEQVTAIAEGFAEIMRQWLSKSEFAEMKRLNETSEAFADGTCCASHNYCDANMAMMESFEHVTGRMLTVESEDKAMSDADCALWGDAWELARKLYLGTQR